MGRLPGIAVVAVVALAALRCQKAPDRQTAPPPTPPQRASSPLEQARALGEAGRLDAALDKLAGAGSDADALAYAGKLWARKAETAPLPTPPPPPSPRPRRGGPPPVPEFKPEELRAIESFERALASQPGHVQASLGLADLLAPHSLRRYASDVGKGSRRGKRRPAAEPPAEGEVDYRPERVIQTYRSAAQGDPTAREPVERLVDFSLRMGRLDEAEEGLQELLRREKESADPLIRYGDFLLDLRKDSLGAIEQYRQALIWRPDDEATRAKIADIYISQAIQLYGKNQYGVAQARLDDAQKYVTDPRSPQGLKIQDYRSKLQAIRRPAPAK
jgi:tetratricopeptide (TPR) repeat protein